MFNLQTWCPICWCSVTGPVESQINPMIICFSLKNHFRLPFTFVTKEVAEATCNCLLAQAEQADKKGKSKAAAERMILEEFGRCLMSVINSAGKAKGDPCAMHC
ncbi:lin-54-like isoform X1 [Sigmodon hispidus]